MGRFEILHSANGDTIHAAGGIDPLQPGGAADGPHTSGGDMFHSVGGIDSLHASGAGDGLHSSGGLDPLHGSGDMLHGSAPGGLHPLHSPGTPTGTGDALSSITVNSLDGSSFMTDLRSQNTRNSSPPNRMGQGSLGRGGQGRQSLSPNVLDHGMSSVSTVDHMSGGHGSAGNPPNHFDHTVYDQGIFDVTTAIGMGIPVDITTAAYETGTVNHGGFENSPRGQNNQGNVGHIRHVTLEQLTLDQGLGHGSGAGVPVSTTQGSFSGGHGSHQRPQSGAQRSIGIGSRGTGHGPEVAGVHRSINEVTTSPRKLPTGVDVPRPAASFGTQGSGKTAQGMDPGQSDPVVESKSTIYLSSLMFYPETHIRYFILNKKETI